MLVFLSWRSKYPSVPKLCMLLTHSDLEYLTYGHVVYHRLDSLGLKDTLVALFKPEYQPALNLLRRELVMNRYFPARTYAISIRDEDIGQARSGKGIVLTEHQYGGVQFTHIVMLGFPTKAAAEFWVTDTLDRNPEWSIKRSDPSNIGGDDACDADWQPE